MKFATLLIKALIDSECFTNQSLWITSGTRRHLIKECSPRQGAERAPSYQTALLVKTFKCSVVWKWVFLSPICVQITRSVSFGWSPSSRGGQRNLFSWSTQALPKPQNVSVVITLLRQAPDASQAPEQGCPEMLWSYTDFKGNGYILFKQNGFTWARIRNLSPSGCAVSHWTSPKTLGAGHTLA